MGIFDTIHGSVVCPHCGKITEVMDQVKWSECFMGYIGVGDYIDADDGIYTYGSGVRSQLVDLCRHCKEEIIFYVTVKDKTLISIDCIK